MRLLAISKNAQLDDYKKNIQNYTTWKEMGKYFDQIHLIVQSPHFKYHKAQYDNIYVYWLPKTVAPLDYILFNIIAAFLGTTLSIKNGIDVVNGEIAALFIKAVTGKPLVLQIQGQLLNLPSSSYSRFKRWYIKNITKFVCKHADRIRVVSKEIANSVKLEGIEESKIFVIPSRCDTNMFDNKLFTLSRNKLRRELGFSEEEIVLIFIGRLILTKDVSSILKAFKLLRKKYDKVKLLVVGDGELEENLKQEARDLEIWKDINFYGRVAYKKIPEILTCGDIFLSPSIDEGMPRSVMEAQAMRLPVIVTPVGGNPEIVKDMETGMIVQTYNPKQIAEAVQYLIDNPKAAEKMGENARTFIVENHDFSTCIKTFAEIMSFAK